MAMQERQSLQDYFKDCDDKELMREALSLDDLIHNAECFGSKDVIMLDAICGELERRGYEVRQITSLLFTSPGGETISDAVLYAEREIQNKGRR